MKESRIFKIAAQLDLAYQNAGVVAINRMNDAKNEASRHFWRAVAGVLQRPHYCQSWLTDEIKNWQKIRSIQTILKA